MVTISVLRSPAPAAAFLLIALCLSGFCAQSQLIVNGSNVSEQVEKKYIQFMYYVPKGKLKPVYYIDHGVTEVDVTSQQQIKIDNIQIVSDMSPMLVLNLLYKCGWEYLGDMHYQREPMTYNWYVYTLKRREEEKQ